MTPTVSTMSDAHLLPRRRGYVRRYVLDDEAVLYDPVQDAVHYLNATARAIWERCDGRHDLEGIAAEVAEVFGIASSAERTPTRVREDVRRATAELAGNGLIDLVEGAGA